MGRAARPRCFNWCRSPIGTPLPAACRTRGRCGMRPRARRIFALLDCGDRLPGHPDAVAKVALRHFARQEAQGANIVGERQLSHASPGDSWLRRRSAQQFGQHDAKQRRVDDLDRRFGERHPARRPRGAGVGRAARPRAAIAAGLARRSPRRSGLPNRAPADAPMITTSSDGDICRLPASRTRRLPA